MIFARLVHFKKVSATVLAPATYTIYMAYIVVAKARERAGGRGGVGIYTVRESIESSDKRAIVGDIGHNRALIK